MDSVVSRFRCSRCKSTLTDLRISEINQHLKNHGAAPIQAVNSYIGKGFFQKRINKKKRANQSDLQKLKKDIELKDLQIKHLKNKLNKSPLSQPPQKTFYDSEVWLQLRFRVLRESRRVCALCKTSEGQMHVDHIKPRSTHPDLALEISNLQVLCRDCNIGKSNKDDTDFR